jgi:hypothetical protein
MRIYSLLPTHLHGTVLNYLSTKTSLRHLHPRLGPPLDPIAGAFI